MRGWMRSVAVILLGASLVPTHWCCVLGFESAPCHAAQPTPAGKQAVRTCCAAAARSATREKSPEGANWSGTERSCCRAVAAAVTVKSVVLQQDLAVVLPLAYNVTPDAITPPAEVNEPAGLKGRLRPDLLTQLCRWNC
jgi:hypothetical protein